METSIGSMLTKSQRLILGCLILILVDVIWVSSSELTKFIYNNETFEKPFFCTYIKTSMFTLYLFGFLFWPPWKDNCLRSTSYVYIDPNKDDESYQTEANSSLSNPIYVPVKTPERENFDRSSGTESDDSTVRSVRFNKLAEVRHMSEIDATEALLARLSYQASLRAGEMAKRAASRLPVLRVANIALVFCLLWFIANYTYQVALSETEAGMVNVLSSTSSLFTLILAAIFPSNQVDRFTLSKLVAVFLSITGIVLVSFSDLSLEKEIPLGAVLSLFSAFFYAAYLVFLRRKVDHEDKIDIPLFFGFVGLFNLILLWPLFFFLHFSKLETFEWPTKEQMMLLLLNGLLGTVISEALWLCKKTTIVEENGKGEHNKNKCTITKVDSTERCRILQPSKKTNFSRKCAKSKDFKQKDQQVHSPLHKEIVDSQHLVDPRLCEKYSIPKMPRERSWTIPVFPPKSSLLGNNKALESCDRQTYVYDNGTETESVCTGNHTKSFDTDLQNKCTFLVHLGGSACALFLASLLIWFILGNDLLDNIFIKPKVSRVGFRQLPQYVGGEIIYLFTSTFKTIGRILVISLAAIFS